MALDLSLGLGGTGFDSGFLSFINAGKVAKAEAAGQVGAAQAAAQAQIVASNNQTALYTKVAIAVIVIIVFFGLILILKR